MLAGDDKYHVRGHCGKVEYVYTKMPALQTLQVQTLLDSGETKDQNDWERSRIGMTSVDIEENKQAIFRSARGAYIEAVRHCVN